MTQPQFSVVIPAHDEVQNLPALPGGLRALVGAQAGEVIVVKDGSGKRHRPGSRPPLRRLAVASGAPPSTALRTIRGGIRAARVEIVATLDSDGQNPSQNPGELIAAFRAAPPEVGMIQRGAGQVPQQCVKTSRLAPCQCHPRRGAARRLPRFGLCAAGLLAAGLSRPAVAQAPAPRHADADQARRIAGAGHAGHPCAAHGRAVALQQLAARTCRLPRPSWRELADLALAARLRGRALVGRSGRPAGQDCRYAPGRGGTMTRATAAARGLAFRSLQREPTLLPRRGTRRGRAFTHRRRRPLRGGNWGPSWPCRTPPDDCGAAESGASCQYGFASIPLVPPRRTGQKERITR